MNNTAQRESDSCHSWCCWRLIISRMARFRCSSLSSFVENYIDGRKFTLHFAPVLSPFVVYCRAMLCIARLLPSPGVFPSRSWVAPKRIKISSKFFYSLVATPFYFFHTKRGGDVPTGTPLTGASNARGMKNDDFRPIYRSVSETVIVRCADSARQFVSIKFPFHPYNI